MTIPTARLFKRQVNRSLAGNVLVFLVVLVLAMFMVLPVVYAINSAFKPLDEIYVFPPRMLVRHPTLDNFLQLGLLTADFWVPLSKYIFNSIFVCIVATIGHTVLSSMAAYPLSKLKFVGQSFVSRMVKLSLLFTSAAMLIPQYIVMAQLNIVNTYGAYIFPALQSALGLYLMQNFMSQIPDELLEAARIDGANELTIYWRVVMPCVKPAWLTVTIFAFQTIWNSSGITQLSTLVYDEKLKMIASLLSQVVAGGTARAGAGAAMGFVLMIPPVTLFLMSQSRIIETMSTSGMK